MTGLVVDTSALLAYFDTNEPQHEAVVPVIDAAAAGPLVVSPYVIAELDFLVLTRHGVQAQREVLAELTGGAWELATMDRERLVAAADIVERYSDIPIGVTDASNIVLAEAYRTRAIATLDRRHFAVLRLGDGSAPEVLP